MSQPSPELVINLAINYITKNIKIPPVLFRHAKTLRHSEGCISSDSSSVVKYILNAGYRDVNLLRQFVDG